jgi:cell division FtsZ-interacting protein ZapD
VPAKRVSLWKRSVIIAVSLGSRGNLDAPSGFVWLHRPQRATRSVFCYSFASASPANDMLTIVLLLSGLRVERFDGSVTLAAGRPGID